MKAREPKAALFWETVNGGKNNKVEALLIVLFIMPLMLPFMGINALIDRGANYHDFNFMGLDRLPKDLLGVYFPIINISFWVVYFVVSIAVIINISRFVFKKLDEIFIQNSTALKNKFSPLETVVFASLRIAEELEKYSRSKMPSDFGFGGDFDWIEGCYYKILSGRKPTGSFRGPSIETNSFFYKLTNDSEIIDRLDSRSWYSENEMRSDQTFSKLYELRDHTHRSYLWGDYDQGVKVYRALAETFLAAQKKEKESFKRNLDYALKLYVEYSHSKAQLKGIPHYTIKLAPKILMTMILIGVLLLSAIGMVLFLPNIIVNLALSKFNLTLDIARAKEIRDVFMVLIGLSPLMKVWKQKQG